MASLPIIQLHKYDKLHAQDGARKYDRVARHSE